MDTYATSIPRQKLSKSEKTKKWEKDTIDAIIGLSKFNGGGGISHVNDKDVINSTYKYYNGVIDDSDYNHVLKPYGKTRGNFPAKLFNYNIIKPIIDLLIGEYQKRPFNWQVIVSNPDVITEKERERVAVLEANLKQHFINELNDRGIETGVPSEDVPEPQEVLDLFERSYKDYRVIMADNAMQFILRHQEMFRKFEDGFFHFLVSGVVVSERYIENEEVKYKILNPLDVDYDKSPDVKFIEDGNHAIVRVPSNVSDIIDSYYEELTPEQIDDLENPVNNDTSLFTSIDDTSRFGDSKSRIIEVFKVYWKSRKRIGILTFIDEDGEFDETIVEDGYKADKDNGESIRWLWVNESWQGTRIDENIYVRVGPVEVQRNSLDNKSECKLPINGRKYSDVNADNISLVMLGIPYQITYNIIHYRLEIALAKAKGLIAQLDINIIPPSLGMDKFLYYIDALGIAWADYSKEGVNMNPQHQTLIDLSFKEIEQYIALLDFTISSWERLSGVTRQRQGAIGQYDAVGTTEQAIIQSSHITEDYFVKYSHFQQRDLKACIDYSKIAWINGKKGQYIMPDFTIAYLNIDGIEYMDSEFGVFVEGTNKDRHKIEALRQLAQPLIQNGAPISTVAELFQSDNFVVLKEKILKTEEKIQEIQQQASQVQAQMEAEMENKRMEAERVKMANDNEQNQLDRQNRIDVALIQAQGNEDDESTQVKREEIGKKYGIEERKLALENKRIEVDRKKHEASLEVEKKKINSTSNNGKK